MKKALRSPAFYAALVVLLGLLLFLVLRSGPSRTTIALGAYEQDLAVPGKVLTATIHDNSDAVTGKLKDGTSYVVQYPDRLTDTLTTKLVAAVPGTTTSHSKSNPWLDALGSWLPFVVLIGLFLWLVNSLQGGGSKVMQFGKAKARTAGKDQPKVTFADVAGADEAVAELQEIKEFLESPGRFQSLGAKIPKGVLLFGPPGTGKTLLARAVAGEAGVPFFSISGSDFVEMFVGVGASRVRDLFEQAKNNAPAIVFMDEIDAVGRHRGAGLGGGHDEREQTLNQLLVEMDGFDVRGGVILIAATNRPDILDPALLRPGRFDRQIVVDRPDLVGRRKILAVHAEGKPMTRSADLDVLAKRTPGFTGADLANLLNEAAILTARRNLRQIGIRECEEAIDRVLAGPERKTLVMSEHDKLVTAYHEAGHAIVGHVLPHADPIHKVSIVARSRSLGLTFTLPEDRYNHSRSQLRDSMAMCLGGRTAEEIVFAEPTTGAENDIEKVSRIARAMVTEYGMSDELGPQQLGQREGEVFLGRDFGHQANYSEAVAAAIDREVRVLIDEAHSRARDVLTRYRAVLDRMAAALVEKETLDPMALTEILGPLAPWPTDGSVPAGASRPGRRPGSLLPTDPIPVDPVGVGNGGRVRGRKAARPVAVPGRRAPVGVATRTASRAAVALPKGAAKKTASPSSSSSSKRRTPSAAAAPARKSRAATPATAAGRSRSASAGATSRAARRRRHRPPGGPSEAVRAVTTAGEQDRPAPRLGLVGEEPGDESKAAEAAPVDLPRIEKAVREILIAIGEDPDRDGLQATPLRVARMYEEIFSGLKEDPGEHLSVVFEADHDEMVMVKDIPVYSVCEHHLVPWFGAAHVAYIPNEDGRITGLSKLARLVDGYSRRPQVQERLTTQVADRLEEVLAPRGVLVVVEAEHLCMSMRGVRKPGTLTVTSAVRGLMRDSVAARSEAMSFIHGRR